MISENIRNLALIMCAILVISYISSMKIVSFSIYFFFFLLFFLPDSARSQAPSDSEPGRLTLYGALGSINGARLGAVYNVSPSVSIELAAGYVSVKLIEEGGKNERTNGYSLTLGGNWHIIPRAMICPIISLQAIYVRTGPEIQGNVQQRVALVPSVGSMYTFMSDISVFFRFGPAFHLTDELGDSVFEMLTQFDAGLTYRF
jgi:hypothetical protein